MEKGRMNYLTRKRVGIQIFWFVADAAISILIGIGAGLVIVELIA